MSDEGNSTPVRRAMIMLSSGELRSPKITVTDDEGRFVFSALPAGAFSLKASKAGWVDAYFGSHHPGRGPGIPLAVASGQRVTPTMKMLRGAAIGGAVTDERGQRARDARMQLLQVKTINGERSLVTVTGAFGYPVTDDRGEYRFWGLPPGDYLVAATGASGFLLGEWRDVSPEEIAWAQQVGAEGAAAAPPPRSSFLGYAPVYYPGTLDAMSATTVTVGRGEERLGVDFVIHASATSRVEGTLTTNGGQPPSGNVQLRLLFKTPQPGDYVQRVGSTRPSIQNGAFTFSSVMPGSYVLMALETGQNTRWASQDVDVNGADIAGITLTLEAGRTVSGRVILDGQTAGSMSAVRVGAVLAQPNSAFSVSIPVVTPQPDGMFTLTGLVPGRYHFTVTPPSSAWTLRNASLDGEDAADQGFEIQLGADRVGAMLTLTDRASELSGSLLDAAGVPASALSIIVFPTNRTVWGAAPRRVRATHPATDGRYRIIGLPSGEYYIAAVTDFDVTDLDDTTFFNGIAAAALRLTVDEGQKKVVDLKVAGGGHRP